jgi:hypothetical protein
MRWRRGGRERGLGRCILSLRRRCRRLLYSLEGTGVSDPDLCRQGEMGVLNKSSFQMLLR